MQRFLAALLCLFLAPATAAAQEFVEVEGLISDEDFYRLVACAAPPGGACTKPIIRWPADERRSLRVGIAAVAPDFADYRFDLVDIAIDDAIEEINGAGADLYLERAYEPPFDVPFFLTDTPQGGQISGTGVPELDNAVIAIGRVALRSRGETIVAAAIALSRDIRRREIASIVLEELVQAMGLPTDISSPAYERSIFSENGNSTVWLRGQDLAALRRHYPRL